MALTDPFSLREVRQMSGAADTILLTATRNADLETPIGAFMRFDDGGPAFLLESVEGGERLGRYSFLGVGPRRLLTVRDNKATIQSRPVGVTEFSPDLPTETFDVPDPLAALRHFMPKRRILPSADIPRFPGGAVGALAYDAVSTFEPTVPLPTRDPTGVPMAAFQETDLVLVFDHLTHTLSAVAALHTEAPDIEGRYAIAERAIFEALERTGRPTESELASLTRRSRAESSEGPEATTRPVGLEPIEVSMGRDRYESEVRKAKEAIAAGEAIQIVVARRQTFEHPVVNGAPGQPGVKLDEVSIYRALRRVNPSPYLFFVRMPEFSVVGASPELLVRVEGDRMTTHPIAGTRPRGATPAEDDALVQALQRDPKERAEHVMLVDLGRNDLGRVARAGTVAVTKYMEVERYSHVLHLVSNVEARLKPGCDSLDALRSIFPAGTLSGAPKVRAMQLIAEAEGERRGLYGGAVGYLGYDGNLDTAITIRSAVLKDDRIHLTVGAGIVAGSVPEREFEETDHKAGAVKLAIEMAIAEATDQSTSAARSGSTAVGTPSAQVQAATSAADAAASAAEAAASA
ncbi:MAG TPA: anthranilate synthase component I family protein [Terriglobales bacterium]|nr:anthranilate synthase component I family protein [Terriglobales bacterium]